VKYNKPSLSYQDQADQLLNRGLIANKAELIQRLIAVSYYRLSAYWYPFKQPDNSFEANTTLEAVWRRYTFDRQLRLLVMDAIERAEITIRTGLAYELTQAHGPFGYLDIKNFPKVAAAVHKRLLDELHENAERSREAFVEHFKKTYDEFPDLPLWAATETMTFGQMLTMFRSCGKHIQKDIALLFQLTGNVLLSWLFTLNYVRNLCAHHYRLWNREIAIKPLIPHNDPRWHAPNAVSNNRTFAVLTLLRYLLWQTAPQSHWREMLYSVFDDYPEIPLIDMGIPANWREHPLWK